MLKKSTRILLVLVAVLLMVGTYGYHAQAAGVTELKIIWAQWDPSDYLQKLVQDYTAKTGIKVTIIQEPWSSYQNRVYAEWAAKGDAFDMLVGDSQWLGLGATQGHYVELTDFMKSNGFDKSVTPATLKYYGEYPAGSTKYWSYPTEGDADGWSYRKDLFTDPKEMADFKAKYGYDLAVPKTWKELMDIAKFFTRKDKNLYGVGLYTQIDYDAMTMGFENVMFSYGGDWWDPKDYHVTGVVNSDANVKALQYYHDLYACCSPPGMSNAFFVEVNNAFTSGQIAMGMNFFAFFPALANKATNKFSDVTGYFSNPAGPDGKRFAALGGQGMSISAYTSKEKQQASMDFLKWFASDEVQAKWASLGGYTCNIKVLASPEFLKVAPFNAAFAETMNFVKDFWNIPAYAPLLQSAQQTEHEFIVNGTGTAKDALDGLAKQWEEILKDPNAGVPKP